MFLHRLQQSRLHLGGCAVDLVGEDDLTEDGSGDELKVTAVRHEDIAAGDIARDEIGGELNTLKLQRRTLRQRAYRCGLGKSGHAFQQQVSARQ